MDSGAGQFGQGDLPVYHDTLGGRGDPPQSQASGDLALVHAPAPGQGKFFRMGHNQQTVGGGIFHGPSHQPAVNDRSAVIGDGNRSGQLHFAVLGEFFPLALLAYRPDRIHPGCAA